MKTLFSAKDVENCHFVVLFGTQLGNAGSIAEGVIETAKSHGWTTLLYSLNQIKDINELAKTRCPIVIITSTTGDGEAPENADKFWRQIHKKTLAPTTLNAVKYTLLGLGDTNFNNFCNCGKQLHKRFQELRAEVFYQPAWADDAVGTHTVVESWLDGLWPVLKQTIAIEVSSGDSVGKSFEDLDSSKLQITLSNKDVKMESTKSLEGGGDMSLTLPACPKVALCLEYSDSSPEPLDLRTPPMAYPLLGGPVLTGTILSAKYLTKLNAVKTALELKLHTEEPLEFEPGDAIGIVCPNSFEEVDLLLERLGEKENANKCLLFSLNPDVVKGKFPGHIPKSKTTLRDILTNYCDIRTVPKKAFLRYLAENTSDLAEKSTLLHLCSKEGSTAYEETFRLNSLSMLDILLRFPSCKPSIEAMVENLPRLIPRAYSISSSPLHSTSSFTIAFNIIDIPKENGRQYYRIGVCTGWLHEIAKSLILEPLPEKPQDIPLKCLPPKPDEFNPSWNKILFYRRKNHNFRLPTNVSAPVIMVGPGTGVAPFIGFLHHRQLQQKGGEEIGKLFLYFGCRNRDRDFLYQETLENLQSDGVLTKLNVSFSRDQLENNCKYVQDYMLLNQEEIVQTLLDNEGYFYVCGDAKNMAKNVREKLVLCIQNVKGISEKEALGEVANLVLSKRYLQDIWA